MGGGGLSDTPGGMPILAFILWDVFVSKASPHGNVTFQKVNVLISVTYVMVYTTNKI